MRSSVQRGPGITVDKTDDSEAVLGMLGDLRREEAGHVTRADDDHVLDVGGVSPADNADQGAEQEHEEDREEPEEDQACQRRVAEARDLGDHDNAPRPQRHHLEDAEQIVDSRVVRALLITIVEPLYVGEQHPERQAQHEQNELPACRDRVEDGRRRRQDQREDKRRREPDDVGHEEQATH